MPYNEHIARARRLRLLRILHEADGYRLNDIMLGKLLDNYGYNVSNDQLRTDAAWLSEQGLVTVQDFDDVQLISLTQRGADVAAGKITTPGVDRPAPGR
ncbi:MAG: ArsR family transcriptional regulator [Gammaproteobacteria bacterium]